MLINMNEIILERLRQQLLTRTSFKDFPESVWKRAGALNTWSTNAIEGNTLSWSDVEKLLIEDRTVAGKPTRDVLETLQHESAFHGLLQRLAKPITMATVAELHESVFRGVLVDAGQWRRINVRIAGLKHVPPRMEKVIPSLEDWGEEYNRRDTLGEGVFFLAAWMHHEFEAIHPFSNGNGRVGRLLLNLHFLKHNWPPVHMLPPDKDRYLRHMEKGHSGDLSGLEGFLRICMARSLVDLLDQVGTKDDELLSMKELGRLGPYSAQYLSLRAGQGELPAVMVRGDWMSSRRAIDVYRELLGRSQRRAKLKSVKRKTR